MVCPLVGGVFLQLPTGKLCHAWPEPLVQPDHQVDVAVSAEVLVVLVGALEKDLVLCVGGSAVGVKRGPDGEVRLREGRRSLVVTPL